MLDGDSSDQQMARIRITSLEVSVISTTVIWIKWGPHSLSAETPKYVNQLPCALGCVLESVHATNYQPSLLVLSGLVFGIFEYFALLLT